MNQGAEANLHLAAVGRKTLPVFVFFVLVCLFLYTVSLSIL